MKIMTNFYKKISRRTWQSLDGETRHDVDYIITNNPPIITGGRVLNIVNTGSDHRPVMAEVKINTRRKGMTLTTKKTIQLDTKQLMKKEEVQPQLETRFSALENKENESVDEVNTNISNILQDAAAEMATKEQGYISVKTKSNNKSTTAQSTTN